MMAASFLDLIVVLLWPLVLSAAAWVIAIKALGATDEISEVVQALTRPNGVEENAEGGEVSLRQSHLSAIASADGSWLPVHFRRTRHTAFHVSGQKGRAMKRTLLRDEERRGDRTTAVGMQRGHELSEYASPVKSSPVIASAPLRTALLVLFAAELIAAAAPPAHAGRFEFDQRRTEIRFAFKMAYSTQRGRFTKATGTLDYDEAAPEKSKISASIAASSLSTGEALVDSELKGASFFNVEASPVIAFKSVAVKPLSATAADVSGEITVNGVTKPVTLKVNLKPHDDPALKHDAGARKFVATTRIQRSAFNMTDYQSMVDDDIDIEIDAIVRPR